MDKVLKKSKEVNIIPFAALKMAEYTVGVVMTKVNVASVIFMVSIASNKKLNKKLKILKL